MFLCELPCLSVNGLLLLNFVILIFQRKKFVSRKYLRFATFHSLRITLPPVLDRGIGKLRQAPGREHRAAQGQRSITFRSSSRVWRHRERRSQSAAFDLCYSLGVLRNLFNFMLHLLLYRLSSKLSGLCGDMLKVHVGGEMSTPEQGFPFRNFPQTN